MKSSLSEALTGRSSLCPCLGPMPQQVISENKRHHCFADRYGANANAWIMAALREDLRLIAMAIDRLPGRED